MHCAGAIQALVNIFWMARDSVLLVTTSEVWERGNVKNDIHLALTNSYGDHNHATGLKVCSQHLCKQACQVVAFSPFALATHSKVEMENKQLQVNSDGIALILRARGEAGYGFVMEYHKAAASSNFSWQIILMFPVGTIISAVLTCGGVLSASQVE